MQAKMLSHPTMVRSSTPTVAQMDGIEASCEIWGAWASGVPAGEAGSDPSRIRRPDDLVRLELKPGVESALQEPVDENGRLNKAISG